MQRRPWHRGLTFIFSDVWLVAGSSQRNGCRTAFPPHENSSACVWIGLVPGILLWWNQWNCKKQNVIVIFALHCLDPSHSCHWREADGRPITEQSIPIPAWRPVEQRYWTMSRGHPAELGRVSVHVFAQTGTFSTASCHVFDWSSSRDNTRPNRLILSPINHRKDSVHLQSLAKDKRSIFFFLKSGKRLKGEVVHTYCTYCTYPIFVPSVSHTEARVQGYSKYTRSNKA